MNKSKLMSAIAQENNRLIAEFMNLDMYPPHDDYPLLYDYSHIDQDPQWYALEEFQYHTSWGWLMPVVEKIESLGYTFEKNYQSIDKDWQSLIVKGNDILYQEFNNDSLKSSYYVVVEFIKWYNENKGSLPTNN